MALMQTVSINRNVEHAWATLFALVLDIEHYPLFVPRCTRVRVLSRRQMENERTEIISRMTVGVQPIQISYINRTLADRPARRISVDSHDGPLRHLAVQWRFVPAGERRTQIALAATYEFRSLLVSGLASGAFTALFGQMVEAFKRRADQLGDAPTAAAGAAGS